MASTNPSSTRYTRPYRSKRHPPCDQCRRKKLRCEAGNQSVCQRCEKGGSGCSFSGMRSPALLEVGLTVTDSAPHQEDDVIVDQNVAQSELEADFTIDPVIESQAIQHSIPDDYTSPRPAGQTIQTLDGLKGFSAQVVGASGESDPYLLRHCKFNDHGFLLFHQVHFRNAGGVPLEEKIPVHFLVAADGVYDSLKEETRFTEKRNRREELNALVSVECGQRLVALFVKFIFPSLPIISRSQFGLTGSRTMPEEQVIQNTPVHLLAAIYASAQPFAQFDEYLCLVNAYSEPPTERLWHIVLELILEEIHTPHLAVLQAGLLYLHKPVQGKQSALADSPFVWSLVGLLVGVATSLGLTLECRPMGLPAWEKRLRRRLWWTLYAEDKWRSLLLGRPPYIRNDEWDVIDLDEDDFKRDGAGISFVGVPDTAEQDGASFRYFTQLSRIADHIQRSLYSLRAAQRLSSNFADSVNTARSLLQQLKSWYSNLPSELKLHNQPFKPMNSPESQSICLHFAYILLEMFIFRALLRPMVRSATPPPLYDEGSDPKPFSNFFDDFIADIFNEEDSERVPAIDMSHDNGTGSAVLQAAENCGATMLRLVMKMGGSGLNGFWYSWCRVGFATVSSFMMQLLIQAPSTDHAIRAKRLMDTWHQTLRSQSKGCEMMNLALVRLDAPHWTGFSRSFYLPKHVDDVLGRGVGG